MHLFSEYSKETGYEAELVFSFKPDDSRVTVQLKEPEFNSERVEELESKEKDIQSFMKKFYGQNYIGMIYNSKKNLQSQISTLIMNTLEKEQRKKLNEHCF